MRSVINCVWERAVIIIECRASGDNENGIGIVAGNNMGVYVRMCGRVGEWKGVSKWLVGVAVGSTMWECEDGEKKLRENVCFDYCARVVGLRHCTAVAGMR